mmetsp:Transcript_146955/g.471774  ORF Transcript_146955/g.471774 Transcript_146955/m.471774 type:complete len:248 (+) Transcript_146955:42-785(+)
MCKVPNPRQWLLLLCLGLNGCVGIQTAQTVQVARSVAVVAPGGANETAPEGGPTVDDEADMVVVPYGCLVAAAVGSGVAALSAPLLLESLGFGALGVSADSLASAWQASTGAAGIAKGSFFARLQSLAMGGHLTKAAVVVSGTVVVELMLSFCSAVDKLFGSTGALLAKATVATKNALGAAASAVAGVAVDFADVLQNVTATTMHNVKSSKAVHNVVNTTVETSKSVWRNITGVAGSLSRAMGNLFR